MKMLENITEKDQGLNALKVRKKLVGTGMYTGVDENKLKIEKK